jgi:branched-chain amino acid transport system substrate-binding protein
MLGISLALVLATGVPAKAQEPPFEINVILSLTGGASFIGSAEQQSLRLAEEYTNKHGGIKGRPIKFVFADDQSSPQNAVQLMNQAISKKAAIVLGSDTTATCAAIDPLAQRSSTVQYCFSPGTLPQAGGNAFAASVSATEDGPILLKYFRERKWTRIAAITATDASGQSFDGPFDAAIKLPENKDLTVVAREHFTPTDVSVTAQMVHIKDGNPQVIIALATGTAFATLLHGLHDAAITAPVVASFSNMNYSQLAEYAPFLPKELYFMSRRAVLPELDAPPAVKRAQKIFGDTFAAARLRPDVSSVLPWDVAMITIDAFRHLGTDATGPQMSAYLKALHGWTGISGMYDFIKFPQRGLGIDDIITYRYDGASFKFTLASKPGGLLK